MRPDGRAFTCLFHGYVYARVPGKMHFFEDAGRQKKNKQTNQTISQSLELLDLRGHGFIPNSCCSGLPSPGLGTTFQTQDTTSEPFPGASLSNLATSATSSFPVGILSRRSCPPVSIGWNWIQPKVKKTMSEPYPKINPSQTWETPSSLCSMCCLISTAQHDIPQLLTHPKITPFQTDSRGRARNVLLIIFLVTHFVFQESRLHVLCCFTKKLLQWQIWQGTRLDKHSQLIERHLFQNEWTWDCER